MRAVRLALYLAAPIALALLPASVFAGGEGICLFKNLLGYECPGCGMTRAFRAAVRGDVLAAIRYNASIVVVFPLVCLVTAKAVVREFTGIAGVDAPRMMRRFHNRLRFRETTVCESVNRKGG